MLSAAPAAATIAVHDIDTARKFYGETLGLKISRDMAPDAFLCEAGGGSMILVYRRPDHQPSAATIASFQVGDTRTMVRELQSRGVEFEDYDQPGLKTENHIASMPGGSKAAWFTDPDGNIIALGEM
jgi:catechol 2,3-dioxygenase-like lactoylglutathione lyase family enzyme